ncbi:acyltransferase [Thermococcus sp. Bubb.Bath]|uniref:acyltransferase n=1 Tax=Thermococcus sp. Bubb.Bath TaxID=1638242 RepID=UPI0014397A0A|nr:acyltransferase [Thermococcus sp. Bubb.Bath]NJF25185.1 N-acetyltransferase [Thermococcus sp. Bubb.Bath]
MSEEAKKYFAHPLAVVEEGAEIGEGTRIWHFAHIRKGSKIGKNCNIGKDVYVDADVEIGNNVKIQNGVSVYHGVKVEDDVFLGPHMTFTNDMYPRAFNQDWEVVPTLVKKGASIGAHATIVCGTTIGEYAMVGAGSVVTKDVPPFGLVYGNPARLRGFVCYCGRPLKEKIGEDEEGIIFKCSHCGREVKIKKEDYERYLREKNL